MRKLNSLNIAWPLVLVLLSGCGMPGALYQTPEIKAAEASANQTSSQKSDQETR